MKVIVGRVPARRSVMVTFLSPDGDAFTKELSSEDAFLLAQQLLDEIREIENGETMAL